MHRWLAGLIVILLWSAAPAAVLAHTGITVSNPADGDVIADELTLVEMTFTTTFEKALSKATLSNEAGVEVPYAELIQGEKSMGMRFEEPLPSGAYTVNWKLLGADGHAVEGQYSFSVELPEAVTEQPAEPVQPVEEEQPAVEQPSAAEQSEPAADAEQASEESVKSEAPAASASKSGRAGMIAVVAGIAVLAFFLIRSFRKQ